MINKNNSWELKVLGYYFLYNIDAYENKERFPNNFCFQLNENEVEV